jgi:hypothetical protein
MPVSTSQRLELELAPLELLGLALGLEVEPVLGLLGLVLGLVVELLPLGLLGLVWAMDRLATPKNAAATAAKRTFVFICAPKGIGKDCLKQGSSCYARSAPGPVVSIANRLSHSCFNRA